MVEREKKGEAARSLALSLRPEEEGPPGAVLGDGQLQRRRVDDAADGLAHHPAVLKRLLRSENEKGKRVRSIEEEESTRAGRAAPGARAT